MPADLQSSGGLLDQGYIAMYNLDFAGAHRCFQEWQHLHPEDPFGPVSDAAAYLFFEFDRLKIMRSEFFTADRAFLNSSKLKPDPRVRSAFEADLQKSKQLSDAILQRQPSDEGALFAAVVRIALQANYDALIDKSYLKALSEIKEARNNANALVARYPDNKDAYLADGVENYLLSQKVAAVRWVLRLTGAETDKAEGLAKLRIVAAQGHYLKPYAKVLLAIAALRDGRKAEARDLMTELATQFPHNDLFQAELKKLSSGP
ncbi:MAG TPA: hypothetical protein VGL97_19420 [Bryobacteraceae bacterium]|jgi:hypothetical protein